MDLFTPILPPDKRHHNFVASLDESYEPVRKVISSWADGFIDRDGKFVREFQTTFNSSFWELYLFAALKQLRYEVDLEIPSPDFVVKTPYGMLSIEAAIASNAENSAPEWESQALFKELRNQTSEEFVNESTIRLSNAIHGKHKRFREDYSKIGVVEKSPFVVAVAPFDRPHAFSQNTEAIIRLLYGFRSRMAKHDGKVTVKIERERSMKKSKDAEIPMGLFTDDQMREVSAIIFSNTATMGKVRALSDDTGHVLFGVLTYQKNSMSPRYEVKEKKDYHEDLLDGLLIFHNPFAQHPLDNRIFFEGGIVQYWFDSKARVPYDNVRDGCLIQRFCFKMVPKKR